MTTEEKAVKQAESHFKMLCNYTDLGMSSATLMRKPTSPEPPKPSPRSGKTQRWSFRRMIDRCLLRPIVRIRIYAMQSPISLQEHGISRMIGIMTAEC